MSTEPEWAVELGKDRVVPRVQDAPAAPEPTQRMWTDNLPPAELPSDAELSPPATPSAQDAPPPPPAAMSPSYAPSPPIAPPPAVPGPAVPGPARAETPWAGLERSAPPVELPPYPPPPPMAGPMYPRPGYPPAVSYPGYGAPAFGPPSQAPVPRYGYADTTPIWSIISFCCVAASLLGGLMLCGIPVLITAPTGIVLGVVGHAKGESMGKWAAIANGAVAALAVLVFVLFIAAIGGA
ncbi:hypothetical protein ACIA5E_09910 [Nocardia asteroides]|uniref:hypothetical protein n=1 Tax=Nocardia asteroides TaxID=1824 RepID=UPI0037B642B3